MADLNMSESEEMYLITLAKLAESGQEGPVPLSTLAAELDVLPVSANQMVHKLQTEGVLEYQPYKGVALRPEGQRRANQTLRRRRLWELFLVDRLNMGFQEADDLACRLEHLGSDDLTERLAVFLGHPKVSAQGLPIPSSEESFEIEDEPLSVKKAGREYIVSKISEDALRSFLEGRNVSEGSHIRLLASCCRGDVLFQSEGAQIELAGDASQHIFVQEIRN